MFDNNIETSQAQVRIPCSSLLTDLQTFVGNIWAFVQVTLCGVCSD